MNKLIEIEKKYIPSAVAKSEIWDREQIVFQWFLASDENGSQKVKIVFDLTYAKIVFVKISKSIIELGKSTKKVEYLDLSEFRPNEMIGKDFILKRRSIKEKVFLDRFIRSNGITEYLVEDEGNSAIKEKSFLRLKDVTDDRRYYNQNMCTCFSQEDADNLSFLLNCFI